MEGDVCFFLLDADFAENVIFESFLDLDMHFIMTRQKMLAENKLCVYPN